MIRILSLLLGIALLAGTGCRGQAGPVRPAEPLKMKTWLNANHQGLQLVYDRGGRIVRTAAIERKCQAQTEVTGTCTDEVHYHATHQAGHSDTKRKLDWKLTFNDDPRTFVHLTGAGGRRSGMVTGPRTILEGRAQIPLGKRSARVRVIMERLPGPQERILERAEFSVLGVRLGSQLTIWTKKLPDGTR